ncbi:hypothetical protein [Micromonospora chersina]
MGARLVSLALVRWSYVSDRAFRVLVRMALTALDEPQNGQPAGLYFGGQDLLALSLRNCGGKRESVLRSVRLAVDELIAEGAVERTKQGRSGQNAVFHLTLEGPRRIDSVNSTAARQAESAVPPQGESTVPPQEESAIPDRRNRSFLPRNQEEPVEERGEEEEIAVRTDLTVTRAREAATTPIDSPKCEHGCAKGWLLVGDRIERCPCHANVIPFPTRTKEPA